MLPTQLLNRLLGQPKAIIIIIIIIIMRDGAQ